MLNFERNVFARVAVGGPVHQEMGQPPYCSVITGAAGIALAWLRASHRGSVEAAMQNARGWSARAEEWSRRRAAYYTSDGVFTPETIGHVSVYHGVPGRHVVRALIATEAGEQSDAERLVRRFRRAIRSTSINNTELMGGRAGQVLSCAMLCSNPSLRTPLKVGESLGTQLAEHLMEGLFEQEGRNGALGIAHGKAGVLYAALKWHLAAGSPIPARLSDPIAELSMLGLRTMSGLSWPSHRKGQRVNPLPSWCNGDAGFVFLWLVAAEALKDERYVNLAEATARNVFDRSTDTIPHLCCGLAGRAYALLAVYRKTGQSEWLERAKDLAARAARSVPIDGCESHRLYRGALGVALLLSELDTPELARMPLFEGPS